MGKVMTTRRMDGRAEATTTRRIDGWAKVITATMVGEGDNDKADGWMG